MRKKELAKAERAKRVQEYTGRMIRVPKVTS